MFQKIFFKKTAIFWACPQFGRDQNPVLPTCDFGERFRSLKPIPTQIRINAHIWFRRAARRWDRRRRSSGCAFFHSNPVCVSACRFYVTVRARRKKRRKGRKKVGKKERRRRKLSCRIAGCELVNPSARADFSPVKPSFNRIVGALPDFRRLLFFTRDDCLG